MVLGSRLPDSACSLRFSMFDGDLRIHTIIQDGSVAVHPGEELKMGLWGDRVWVWAVRVWWAALPFAAGPVLAEGLHNASAAWRATASVGLWVVWAFVLVSSLLAHPATLVLVRLAIPSAVAALIWAGLGGSDWGEVALAAAGTGAVAAVSLSAPFGQVFANGISYGDEIRLLLRPPAMLLAGPLPVAAATTVAGTVSGPLLLADERWVFGGVATVAGGALTVVGARSLYSLARRWLVYVPAGLVIHDHLAVQDPVLLRRRAVAGFGPAQPGSDALDLSQGAAGLILELTASQSITLTPPSRRGSRADEIQTNAVLVAPSRPGQAVMLAGQRLLI